jgi:hypothetical protein
MKNTNKMHSNDFFLATAAYAGINCMRLYDPDLEPTTDSAWSDDGNKGRSNARHTGKFQKNRLSVWQCRECPVAIVGNGESNRLM